MKKFFWPAYIISIFLPFYLYKDNEYFVIYIISVFVGLVLINKIYFILPIIYKKDKLIYKLLTVLVALVGLVILIVIYIYSSMSGFHSENCYDLKAKNIFTGHVKNYCNFPPWYTRIELSETNKPWPGNISTICQKPIRTAAINICREKN